MPTSDQPPFLGDWLRERKLGAGGFGVVTLWKNTKTEQRVGESVVVVVVVVDDIMMLPQCFFKILFAVIFEIEIVIEADTTIHFEAKGISRSRVESQRETVTESEMMKTL